MKISTLTLMMLLALLSGCKSDPNILMAYSANQICSRHFISQEPVNFIKQQVIPEALANLPSETQIDVDITTKKVEISANIDGEMKKRTSVFREGMGCTLLHTLTPEALVAQTQHIEFPKSSKSTPLLKSMRKDISLDKFFAHNKPSYAWSDNTFGVAVMHKGQLIAERYDNYRTGDTHMLSWSMAKTLTGLLTGILVDQGKLSLEQTVVFGKHNMTVKNLLNMSSGIEWSETPNIQGYEDLAPMWYFYGDSVQYVSELPKGYTPGQKFEYATGTSQLLSAVVKEASGGNIQTLVDLYHNSLFAPLGINNAIAEYDEAGNLRGGARMFLTIHDWLKIGQLIAQKGQWEGQQVVSEEWISNVVLSNGVSRHYGGHIWLNDMSLWLPSLPKDTVSLRGHRGQYVVIIPSKQLVVARFGAHGSVVTQHLGLANKRLFSAITDLIRQIDN